MNLPPQSCMKEAQGRQIEFYSASIAAKVLGDTDKLKQIFINIVRNACEAVTEGEIIKIFCGQSTDSDKVCIQIHNRCEPIPPEFLPMLTEPFYTTKSSGTDLGLAIVKRIFEAHGGVFSIESSASERTTASLRLPINI